MKIIKIILVCFYVSIGSIYVQAKNVSTQDFKKILTIINDAKDYNSVRGQIDRVVNANKKNNLILSKNQLDQYWKLFKNKEESFNNPFQKEIIGKNGQKITQKPKGIKKQSPLTGQIYAMWRILEIMNPADIRPMSYATIFPGTTIAKDKYLKYCQTVTGNLKYRDRKARVGVLNSSQTRWRSLGIYARPGELIEINSLDRKITNGDKFSVRIGQWSDNVATWRNSCMRWPKIDMTAKIVDNKVKIASPLGGVLYICLPSSFPKNKKLSFKITGGTSMTRFILGKHSQTQWLQMLKKNKNIPWVEMESDLLIFTFRNDVGSRITSPTALMQYWQKVAEVQDQLSMRKKPRYKERFVTDIQISVGYMHAGYPIMAAIGSGENDLINLNKLKKDGAWGWFHELGHNHQLQAWRSPWPGMVEVTVNIFSVYTNEKILRKKIESIGWTKNKVQAAKDDYMKSVKLGDPNNRGGGFFGASLMMLMHLRTQFGWKLFKNIFKAYEMMPKEKLPKSAQDRADMWVKLSSKYTRRNLVPFYATWGCKVSKKAVKEIKSWDLQEYNPKQWPTTSHK